MASLDEFAREQAILAALRTHGRVAVNDLADEFQVSGVTIRKDLNELERRSLLRRVRGGAVSVAASDEGTFEMRLWQRRDSKRAIARAVAPLVQDGDVIAIDSSTTTYYLAQELLNRRNLVVVTNGLRLAVLFMEQSSARVLMPGGVLRRSAGSLVGNIGDVLAGRGRISKGFFGVIGVSTQHGLMDISAEEAQTKHVLSHACDQVYGLFDGTKASGFGLHTFTPPGAVTAIYTDDTVSPDLVAEWAELGVPVHRATSDGLPVLPRTADGRTATPLRGPGAAPTHNRPRPSS